MHAKAGGAYASWTLSDEYGFIDIDGGRPHWGRYMLGRTNGILDRGGPSTPDEKFWMVAVYWQFKHDPRFRDMKQRIDDDHGDAGERLRSPRHRRLTWGPASGGPSDEIGTEQEYSARDIPRTSM